MSLFLRGMPRFDGPALCAEVDPEVWFPETGHSTQGAKALCRLCEVEAECLEYALEHDERHGVWGGKSENERRRLRTRAVRRPVAPDPRMSPPGDRRSGMGAARREVVLSLTRQGWSAERIAEHLRITVRSVERHRAAGRVGAA